MQSGRRVLYSLSRERSHDIPVSLSIHPRANGRPIKSTDCDKCTDTGSLGVTGVTTREKAINLIGYVVLFNAPYR